MLSRAEWRQLRDLADDLRGDNPHLARIMMRRAVPCSPRVAAGVLASVLAIALLFLSSLAATVIAAVLAIVGSFLLAPLAADHHTRR